MNHENDHDYTTPEIDSSYTFGAKNTEPDPNQSACGKSGKGRSDDPARAKDFPWPVMILEHLGDWYVVLNRRNTLGEVTSQWIRLDAVSLKSLREDCARKLSQKL